MTEANFEKDVFSLVNVLFADMEEFATYTAASHQGAIELSSCHVFRLLCMCEVFEMNLPYS